MVQWKVANTESGMNLSAFLRLKFQNTYSAKQLKRAIEHNLCQINQRVERHASTLVAKGDLIECNQEQLEALLTTHAPHIEEKRILYEDSNLAAYDKPAGLSSDQEGMVKLLHQKDPNLRLIHRLDRDTTGVLLFAKNEDILHKMIALFKEYKVHKTYQALVDGVVNHPSGVIDNLLAPRHRYQGQTIWGSSIQGSHARTEWVREKKGSHCTLLSCFPITGVTHQIRVHMSEMGHPILGDYQYARQFECFYKPLRPLLHASKISFPHPRTGNKIEIVSALPLDFEQAIKELI